MLSCRCCFDVFDSSILVVIVYDCSTLVELTSSTSWEEALLDLVKIHPRSGSDLLHVVIPKTDPFFIMDGIWISIQYWSKSHVTLTWQTGPIFVSLRIHPISSELKISRDTVYALHEPVFPPKPMLTSWIVRKKVQQILSLWIQLIHKSQTLLSLSTDFRICLDDPGIDSSLLEHWSQVLLPACSLIQKTNFEITSPSTFAVDFSTLEDDSSRICWVNSSHQSATPPFILSWFAEFIVRNQSYAFDVSPLKWMVHVQLFFFKNPRPNALVALNTGCPLSPKLYTMTSAVAFHCPSSLPLCVPHLHNQDREKSQYFNWDLFAEPFTVQEFDKHSLWYPFLIQSMSLNMDMMIRSSKSSNLFLRVAIFIWIFLRISTAACPGKIFHSNSNGSLSIPNNSLYTLDFWNCWRCSFHFSVDSDCLSMFLRHWTDSE